MSRTARLVVPLRVVLAALLVSLVVTQVAVLPAVFARMATQTPELAGLRWPLLILTVVVIACVEVVVVCAWRLLTMVAQDSIFSARSLGWVDTILAAVGTAWALVLVAGLLVAVAAGPSGVAALLLVVVLVGAAVGLLMVVMRALLVQATTLRTDLDAVI